MLKHLAKSERGIAVIHVGLALFVLTGLLTFVLDHGVMWLGRGEAQNAADAGALAGAVARAFDEITDPPAANGLAFDSAFNAAQSNLVLGEAPGVTVAWTCPGFVPAGTRCARVDVFRDGTNASNALPTFFANMFGVTSQPVHATATARVAFGNATNCMRPFAVADKWLEQAQTPTHFERWHKVKGNLAEWSPHDVYVPPGPGSTGYKVYNPDGTPADIGTQLQLKLGNPSQSMTTIEPGWFLATQLPDGAGGWNSGAADYKLAIANCIGNPVGIGNYLPTETGVMNGPTSMGFADLKATDPTATWNSTTKEVDNSCAPTCAPFSPRIIPIAVFDMDDYQKRDITGDWSPCPIGGRCVKVVNILGFFASHMSGGDIVGYLVMDPGDFVVGNPQVGPNQSFLVSIQLVR